MKLTPKELLSVVEDIDEIIAKALKVKTVDAKKAISMHLDEPLIDAVALLKATKPETQVQAKILCKVVDFLRIFI